MKKSVPKRRRHFIYYKTQRLHRRTDASPRLTTRRSCACVAERCAPPSLPEDSRRRCRSYRDGPLDGSAGDQRLGTYEGRSVQHNLPLMKNTSEPFLRDFESGMSSTLPTTSPMGRLDRIYLGSTEYPLASYQFPVLRVTSVQHLYSPQLFCPRGFSLIRELYILS